MYTEGGFGDGHIIFYGPALITPELPRSLHLLKPNNRMILNILDILIYELRDNQNYDSAYNLDGSQLFVSSDKLCIDIVIIN